MLAKDSKRERIELQRTIDLYMTQIQQMVKNVEERNKKIKEKDDQIMIVKDEIRERDRQIASVKERLTESNKMEQKVKQLEMKYI